MGENQKAKLFARGREQQYGMLLETLSNPDIVLEEEDKEQNVFHERPSSYLFVKTFQKEDGSKYVHFESVTVSQDGMEVSISSHIIRENQLKNKLKSDRLLYKATALDAPANTSAEQPIVSGSLSSDGKGKDISDSVQENGNKSSENEGEKPLSAQIEDASADVNTNPTEAQKEAGNYKKGHVQVGSFDITIEQPQGSVRKGTDANGKHWESKMNNTYGYFRGTEGVDGDHIDVFLSNDIDGWNRQTVFVVDQYNPDGSFDEHKVMLGFNNAEEAKRDYLANYGKGWENGRRIDVSAVNLADFEKWIASSHRKTKPFSEYSSVKKEGSASSETKQSKSTAEEKPFNAIIEMLRKKFPDASMEALTAADRLLREQALPGERQKAIEAVAKALGLKVEWRDTMEKENGTFNPKTRTITIARDSEHALANTFGHEVTHAVRKLSEADYKNLKDAVRRLYSSEKEYNEAVQAYGDEYTGLDFDALEEELIADNIGFMIGGRNDMTQELASRMNHRVLWAIHDAMNKVRNALAKVLHIDSKKNGLLEALDSARATIRETMANAQRIAKEKGQGLSNESDSTKQSLRTQDSAIRDAFVERMRLSGMDVITDETGQRVLDMANSEEVMLSAKQKRALETATIAEQATNNATVVSSADGAKIQNNLEILADNYKKRPNKTRGFITDLSRSLGLVQHEASQYGTFETRNGKLVTIRVSNHNARVSFFDENGEEDGISIVISSHKNKGALNDGKAHLVEYFYPKQSLERSGSKPLADIVKCVSNALDSGKFDDATGIAQRQEVNAKQIREQRVYHGSGAEFDHFDHGHMGEGQGSQVFGWGTYVTSSKAIGESYAQDSARGDSPRMEMEYTGDALTDKEVDLVKYAFDGGMRSYHETEEFLENIANSDKSGAKRSANALALLRKTKPEDWTHPLIGKRQLYTVEIPEDNGSNYLAWKEPLNSEDSERIISGLFDLPSSDIEEMAKRDYAFRNILYGPISTKEKALYVPVLVKGNVLSRPTIFNGGEKKDFGGVYRRLQEWFGSDEAVSKFLSSLGYSGIKYPAGTIHGGAKEGDTNYVIFNEKDAKITDHVRFFRTANGEAYGFTVGGKIYIDPRIATAETPIHEYAHLWATALKSANAKEWQNVVGLMKGTKVWDEVKALYPELKSEDDIADEVLATYSGRRGAERLREEQRKIAKGNGSVFEKAEAISALERVKQALKRFWKGVADFLHIHYTSAEEVADRVMKDLLDGVDPRTFGDVEKGIRFQTSEELNNRFGGRWLDEQTNDDGRHTTQVKSTINSYKKFGDWVKRDSNGRDVDVLDASSGFGLGTAWMRDNGFKVDDVEPFPSESREAPTFSSYDEINKKYDYIISNAVLNVIPDDWRANVLHQMADKLKDGGKLVINVRGAESISKQGKEGETRITLDSPSEILVLRPNGSIKAYQKGFTKSELKEWCEKELGEGYSVEIANNKNAGGSYDTAVVVTKNNESGTVGVASEAGHPSWSAQAMPNSSSKLNNNSTVAKDSEGKIYYK